MMPEQTDDTHPMIHVVGTLIFHVILGIVMKLGERLVIEVSGYVINAITGAIDKALTNIENEPHQNMSLVGEQPLLEEQTHS